MLYNDDSIFVALSPNDVPKKAQRNEPMVAHYWQKVEHGRQ